MLQLTSESSKAQTLHDPCAIPLIQPVVAYGEAQSTLSHPLMPVNTSHNNTHTNWIHPCLCILDHFIVSSNNAMGSYCKALWIILNANITLIRHLNLKWAGETLPYCKSLLTVSNPLHHTVFYFFAKTSVCVSSVSYHILLCAQTPFTCALITIVQIGFPL